MKPSYSDSHRTRLVATLQRIRQFVREGTIVGNVGLSEVDDIIKSRLKPGKVYSIVPSQQYLNELGLKRPDDEIVFFDLTKPNRKIPMRCDILILTEVLEHLFVDDTIVLSNIKMLLADDGLFVLTVPNAATLGHRLRLLFGRNIFWPKNEIVKGVFGGYGHLREYTFQEIKGLLEDDFKILEMEGINGYRKGYKRLFNVLPKTFANTIFVLAKSNAS